jgi:hypothetical protein
MSDHRNIIDNLYRQAKKVLTVYRFSQINERGADVDKLPVKIKKPRND